jgi:hypothetical protein
VGAQPAVGKIGAPGIQWPDSGVQQPRIHEDRNDPDREWPPATDRLNKFADDSQRSSFSSHSQSTA